MTSSQEKAKKSDIDARDRRVVRLHKQYITGGQKDILDAVQMSSDLFDQYKKEQAEIRKLFKKRKRTIPDHDTTKIVERKDPFDTTSWYSQMEELQSVGRRRRRRKRNRVK